MPTRAARRPYFRRSRFAHHASKRPRGESRYARISGSSCCTRTVRCAIWKISHSSSSHVCTPRSDGRMASPHCGQGLVEETLSSKVRLQNVRIDLQTTGPPGRLAAAIPMRKTATGFAPSRHAAGRRPSSTTAPRPRKSPDFDSRTRIGRLERTPCAANAGTREQARSHSPRCGLQLRLREQPADAGRCISLRSAPRSARRHR